MRRLRVVFLGSLLMASFLVSVSARAALVGDSVTCSYTFSVRACDPSMATVIDPGVEFALGSQLQVDIDETSITISQVAGTFGLTTGEMLTIGDMQWSMSPQSVITGVTLGTITELVSQPTQEALSFTMDSVTIDLSGTGAWRTGSSIEILVSHVLVPVPAAVWLFASALGLLSWIRYRAA